MSWGDDDPVLSKPAWGSDDPIIGRRKAEPRQPPARAAAPQEAPPTLLESGWEGLKGSVRTGVARGLYGVGANEWGTSVEEDANKNKEIAARRPVMSLADAKDWTDYPKMVYEGAVQSLPSMAPVVAGGLAGAALGAAAGPFGSLAGGLAGGAAGAFPQFFGDNAARQAEEKKIPLKETDAGLAAGTAVLQSFTDSAASGFMLGIGKIASPLLKVMGKEAAEKMIVRMATRAVESGIAEGSSEAIQQALEVAQANPAKLWEFGPEIQNEIATAAVVGAGMGVVGGGASGIRRPKAAGAPPGPDGLPPGEQSSFMGDEFSGNSRGIGLGNPEAPPSRDPFYPHGTGLPYQYEPNPSGTGFYNPGQLIPEPWDPNQTGMPGPREQKSWSPNPGVMFPEGPQYGPNGQWDPNGTGLPEDATQRRPVPQKPFKPDTSVMFPEEPWNPDSAGAYWPHPPTVPKQPTPVPPNPLIEPTGQKIPNGPKWQPGGLIDSIKKLRGETPDVGNVGNVGNVAPATLTVVEEAKTEMPTVAKVAPSNKAKKTGKAVYDDVQKQLIAAGKTPLQANADATLVRAFYERLATKLGRDAFDVYKARGLKIVGEGGSDPSTGGSGESYDQTAYHGSPDDIPFQKFDSRFLLSGEGHMAFAHGHYLAEDRDLANKNYREKLARQHDIFINGQKIKRDPITFRYLIDGRQVDFGEQEALDFIKTKGGVEKATESLDDDIGVLKDKQIWNDTVNDPNIQSEIEVLQDKKRAIKTLTSNNKMTTKQRGKEGRLYTVEIPDEGYLHWDEEMGDQPKIMKILEENLVGGRGFPTKESVRSRFEGKTGERVYKEIADMVGGEEMASAVLDDIGIPGVKFFDSNSRTTGKRAYAARSMLAAHDSGKTKVPQEHLAYLRRTAAYKPKHNFVIFGDNTAKITSYEQRKKVKRGDITFGPKETVIRLMKSSDASTFMHEAAHLFLNEMRKYAGQSKAIAQDLNEVLQWLGAKDSASITEPQHEKFAKGFELYLREGKAPSKGLAAVFKKFAEWLTKVYADAKQLKVDVPDNIKRVFDRMLAQTEGLENSSSKGVERPAPRSKPFDVADDEEYDAGPMPPVDRDTFSQEERDNLSRWFGNSVVRDSNGAPRRMYHGTSKDVDYDRFKVGRHGVWFTADPSSASTYAKENDSQGYKFENGKYEKTNTRSRVIPAYLRAENPYTGDRPSHISQKDNYKKAQSDWFDVLRRQGYDSWIPASEKGQIVVILKEPTQIKSVFNKGDFNPKNPKMLAQSAIEDETYDQSPLDGEEAQEAKFKNGALRKAKAFGSKLLYLDRTLNPMGNLPEREQLQTRRQLATGRIGLGSDEGKKAFDLMSKLGREDQKKVYSFLTTKDASPTLIPQAIRTQTVAIKKRIEQLGQQLVDRGVLTPKKYESRKGEYLPNVYMKYILEHAGISSNSMRPSLNETKARKDLTDAQRKALGQIEHPAVLTQQALTRMARDIALLDYLKDVSGNRQWAHQRSLISFDGKRVTPEWLKAEAADIKTQRAEAMERNDPAGALAMSEQAARMEAAADEAMMARGDREYDTKLWRQLPDTKQYGMLRGAWVRKEISDDITGAVDFVRHQSTIAKLAGDTNSWLVKAVQLWKISKVPLNPASQSRNFIGNMIQANLFGGIPLHRLPGALSSAVKELRADGEYAQIAKKYGLFHSTMGEVELHELSKIISQGLDPEGANPLSLMKAGYLFSKGIDKATNLYQRSEELFKTAILMDAIKNRDMSEEAAARLADDAVYDYTMVHPSIKWMRNSALGMPFITWSYKTMGALAKTMREHPTRFLPYVAFMATAPMITASIAGLQDDDPERLRKALSDNLRRQNNMYLLPYKDANGNWVFLDVGFFFPWQMPQDLVSAVASGDGKNAWRALNLFSNPAINIIQAMNTGVDPFTNRPIADKRDPLGQQVADIMGYVWSLAVPSVFAGYGAAGKLLDKEMGTGLNRYGEPSNTYSQIAFRAFGFNTYPVNIEAQRSRNLIHMQSDIQQAKSRLTYVIKDQALTQEQKASKIRSYNEKIREMTEDMVKYARESAITPSLAAATRN